MRRYRKIGFLLGAGASSDLGLPTSRDVVPSFDRMMAAPGPQVTREDLELYLQVRWRLTPEEEADFEVVFDLLSLDPEDPRVPGSPKAKRRLSRILREHFARMLFLDGAGTRNHFAKLGPLPSFLGYPVEVWTLNQDLGVERGARSVADGFWGRGPDHEWDERCILEVGMRLVIVLHKVHGSTNWQRNRRGRFFSTDPWRPIDASRAVLVLGHKEKTLARLPYTFGFQARRFKELGMDLVVVVGFGFRDEHIIALLLDALDKGADLLVVSPETSGSFERFRERAAQAKVASPDSTPGRILLLRQRARDFFMGLPGSLRLGTPIDGGGA